MTSDFVTGICFDSPFQCSSMQTIGTFLVLHMLEHLLDTEVLYLAAVAECVGQHPFGCGAAVDTNACGERLVRRNETDK